MSTKASLPPLDLTLPACRGLDPNLPLDTSIFRKDISLIGVKIKAAQTSDFLCAPVLKEVLASVPRIRNIREVHPSLSEDEKLLILRVKAIDELPGAAREFLEKRTHGFVPYTLTLDYNYYSAVEIMQAILPENLADSIPSGYTHTGHIAHLNLREEYLPYKRWIGQIILEKSPSVTTVVNKLDTIDHQFRFFKMELLAGNPDYIVEAHESGCRFKLDFSRVYWNSRLHAEHERLVKLFKPGEVIADVFAGVGPFAIPAAKKGCGLFANDLNPHSFKYLNINVGLNFVEAHVKTSNLDGSAFIKEVLKKCWDNPFSSLSRLPSRREIRETKSKQIKGRSQMSRTRSPARSPTKAECSPEINLGHRRISHFVMNLPDSAVEFLSSFKGSFNSVASESDFIKVYEELPMIHCYCFTKEEDRILAEKDIRSRVERNLGVSIEGLEFHCVRSVAPKKDMYCVSFRLPVSIAIQN